MSQGFGEAPLERHETVEGVSLASFYTLESKQTFRRAAHLHEDIAREMDSVQKLFDHWDRDMRIKRKQALSALDFPDLPLALSLFNYHGERHVRGTTVQDYFFSPRRCTTSSAFHSSHSEIQAGEACSRCGDTISRHAEFFVDVAKQRAEADRLCRPCLVFSVRRVLGPDDTAVEREARNIRSTAWAPAIKPDLADLLLETRTFFSD